MLKEYYRALEKKTAFVNEVCYRTGRTAATVRNWVKYGMRPNDSKDIEILVQVTGIPADKLWSNE